MQVVQIGQTTGGLVAVGKLPLHLQGQGFPEDTKRHTCVFGIDVVSEPYVGAFKHLQVAATLAELLDNNGDGRVDHEAVLQELLYRHVVVIVYDSDRKRDKSKLWKNNNFNLVELVRDEIVNEKPGKVGGKDSSKYILMRMLLEEGLSRAYPGQFGLSGRRSLLVRAMTAANGDCGFAHVIGAEAKGFENCTGTYHYRDPECDELCQVDAYFYLSLTSVMGAQSSRCRHIKSAYELCTPKKVKGQDRAIYDLLLTDGHEYGVPSRYPEANYLREAEGPHQCGVYFATDASAKQSGGRRRRRRRRRQSRQDKKLAKTTTRETTVTTATSTQKTTTTKSRREIKRAKNAKQKEQKAWRKYLEGQFEQEDLYDSGAQ